ncbi:dioxygenase [Shewanella sp. SG41-4]|uniref:DODA-type extradiol aromatic ring-opening family dioxygenase n=1 Tax=Shewanella sp. SG41-4 TaxID=2760976 RepID=UPI0015FFF7A8|nr:class III extradiol ring-cleavage dioxygenase [Shewanella sp. SG41-4]MBB1437786.1 dioxygenase [Shewanella sp. SG41-4]
MQQHQKPLFISHGSPMMAVENSKTSRFLQQLGRQLPTPKAIVVFSAHLDVTDDVVITAGAQPQTVHDFYRFPDELYQIHYPAPGEPALAQQIANMFIHAGIKVNLDPTHGWDHGVWIPLRLMYPQANIPIVQISINTRVGAAQNYRYGQLLTSLKHDNILILGSGGISHNLGEVFRQPKTPNGVNMMNQFITWVEEKLLSNDTESLLNYLQLAPFAKFNHPTQEHFLPLIAVLGASDRGITQKIHQDVEYELLALDAYSFN